MKRWLITGGCGFIGKNLIKFLKENSEDIFSIRIIDNLSVGKLEDLSYTNCIFKEVGISDLDWEKTEIQVIKADIINEEIATQVTKGAEVIVHLAANTGVFPSVQNPRLDCITNVIGTFNYLEACRINGVKKFIFASSGAPIGECIPPIHEELAPHPVSPYGASKLAGEGYCSAYYRTFGVETVALRFGNVYGPGSTHKSSLIAKFIKQALDGESLEVYGDGMQTRDFIYVKDLVNAIWLSSRIEGIGGEIFQIATSKETTVSEVSEYLLEVLKNKGILDVNIFYGKKRIGDVLRNFSDVRKAKERLGWEVKSTLIQGISETIEYFQNESK